MRAVIQRVRQASVLIEEQVHASIDVGLLVLLGIEQADGDQDIQWLAQKIANLRIFADDQGMMNRSVTDVGGSLLVVSQFTLHASTKKGNRPSFVRAAPPTTALPLYELFIRRLQQLVQRPVYSGVFGAYMQIALVNDGPVTLVIDSRNRE